MIESSYRLRLAMEATDSFRIAGIAVRQNLDRNVPVQISVERTINLAHATSPDEADDLVGAETHAGRQGHGRSAGNYRLTIRKPR